MIERAQHVAIRLLGRGRIVRHLPRDAGRRALLTFDDGPAPGSTARVLEILADHDIRAIFFVVGRQVRGAPDLAKRIHEAGHLVANHSFEHRREGTGNYWRTLREIFRCRMELVRLGILGFDSARRNSGGCGFPSC